jgi:photosystem II stability/assembly factor-like uncharacterized protein
VSVTSRPNTPESSPPQVDERTLDERVAELEALIEEARQHARRRRQRNAAIALLGALGALAATYAGGSGVRVGTGRSADSSSPRAAVNAPGVGRWSVPYGPPGAGVGEIVVDPLTSSNVYAAAGGRIFRSTDGGRSWSSSVQIDPRVDGLTIDPQQPSTLYAGTGQGVFKSVDGGRNWSWTGLGQTPRLPGGRRGEGNVGALVVDPTDSSVVYAVAGVTGGHVSKSTDGGRTWRTLPASPSNASALTIDPANPRVLLVTVEDPWTNGTPHGTIAMTTDGGGTWRSVLRRDDFFQGVEVSPAEPGTVYAVGDDHAGNASLFVSAHGGLTWSAMPGPATNLGGLAVDPQVPGTLYVSASKKGVFETTDEGRTWTSLGKRFTGVTVDPTTPSTLYADTEDAILKTVDAGKTWRPADAGIVASGVLSTAIDPHNTNIVYAGTYAGFFRSGDGGHTWRTLRLGVTGQTIAVDPANSTHLLASGSRGILTSTNSGRTWSRAAGSTTEHGGPRNGIDRVTAIQFDPHHPGSVYAASWGNGVIRSADGGRTWHATTHRPAWISSVAGTVAVDPQGTGVLYGSTNGALIRSTNGGSSWKWVFLPKVGAILAVLAIDPADPQTLYASIGDNASRLKPPHLAKSVDGGMHWRSGNDIDVTALTIDPRDPSTMYAGTRFKGVLRTIDGGATWRAFDSGLVARAITILTLDRTGRWLYAGTDGAGLTRIRLR